MNPLRCSTAALVCSFALLATLAGCEKGPPGVTDTEIRIGNTMPYSGPASAYGVNGRANAAYIKKINAEGGINGRKINYITYDDAYSPPKTVEQVRRLVEQDRVLLVFNPLGTAPNTAIQKYLNEKKVPQLFVASGASKWGDYKSNPWTIGWQPNYYAEAKIYAKYIQEHFPNARIAMLFQNDDFGKDYVAGFRQGMGAKANQILIEQSYEVTDPVVDSQLVNMKNRGANVFLNVTTPKFAAMSIRKVVEIGWRPAHFLTQVSVTVGSVINPAGPSNAKGIISSHYLKDPFDPQFANDPAVEQWRAWMKQYNPEANPLDFGNVTAYSVTQTLVQVLKQCGNDLSRENVMRQAANIHDFDLPLLLPGIKINTSPTDYYPISQLQLMRFDGQRWQHFGPVLSAD